jgi:hypothetical protein
MYTGVYATAKGLKLKYFVLLSSVYIHGFIFVKIDASTGILNRFSNLIFFLMHLLIPIVNSTVYIFKLCYDYVLNI